jgi:hypothetical protein
MARLGSIRKGGARRGMELVAVDWVFIEYLFECYGWFWLDMAM